MEFCDQADTGGTAETFLTTHWSLVEGVQKRQDPDRALIGLLLERYWKPVYCFIRRQGHAHQEAEDLTQGFFHEVVLNRQLIQRADPAKGRFRTFLLHALKQYLVDDRLRQSARRNIPKDRLVPLDIPDPPALPETISDLTPEDCFVYAWKSAMLDRVLAEVQAECTSDGLEAHWRVFHDRVLRPILEESEPPPMAEVCHQHGIASEATASNMLVTVKRRFQSTLIARSSRRRTRTTNCRICSARGGSARKRHRSCADIDRVSVRARLFVARVADVDRSRTACRTRLGHSASNRSSLTACSRWGWSPRMPGRDAWSRCCPRIV